MVSPRIRAVVFVFLLIAILSLVGIGPLLAVEPGPLNGSTLEHADGKVLMIEPDMSFILETASGQRLHFQCAGRCRVALQHLQRHVREKAHTDVYYLDMNGKGLLALNVD